MTNEQKEQLRVDLARLNGRDGLPVLAAVSGISKKRLTEILKGDEPSFAEFSTINMLK